MSALFTVPPVAGVTVTEYPDDVLVAVHEAFVPPPEPKHVQFVYEPADGKVGDDGDAVPVVQKVSLPNEVTPDAYVLFAVPQEPVTLTGTPETVTVALLEPLPLAFVQLNVYVVFDDKEPVDCEPDAALAPLQPFDAVQDVGEFVDDHVSVDEPPLVTLVGEAEIVTTGADAAAERLAEHVALELPPFEPEQVQETLPPAEGNDVLLADPFEHCVSGELAVTTDA